MTNLLIKRFVKNSEDVMKPDVRLAYGNLSGIVGIICNALLALLKFIAGLLSGSIAIMADAVNNFSDMAASVVTLLGFKVSSKPADSEHPFGHARFEYISGLVISVFISAVGLNLAKSSMSKIIHPQAVDFSLLSIIILSLSILAKVWLAFFYRYIGKKISSEALGAAFADSRNDCISTGAILVAALISRFTSLNLDGYMGFIISIFIIISGISLIKETMNPILGQAPEKTYVKYVRKKIMSYKGVLGTHDLIIHDYGPGRRFASAHVEMASDGDVIESHDTIDNIERDFLEEDNLHLVIHYDPVVTHDKNVANARMFTVRTMREIHEELDIHDFRMVDGPSHTNYIFDVELPSGFPLTNDELLLEIKEKIQHGEKQIHAVVTFDENYI